MRCFILVAGAAGGIGYAMVQQLTKQNIEVVAFARGSNKLQSMFGHNKLVTCIAGDVLKVQDLLDACVNIDTIIHAVSFPYQKWNETHIPCLVNMLEAAKISGSKFILVDNIYAYGKQPQAVIEDITKFPHTKKGKLRLQMETLVKENIPGCLKISGQELTLLLQQLVGYRPKIRVASSKLIAFLALFSSFMREQKEMMYVTETPVILNATKLEKAMGTIPFTDRMQSLKETMDWIRKDI